MRCSSRKLEFNKSNKTGKDDHISKSLKTKKTKGVVFAHLNVRSIRNKMDDVKYIAENENVDVFTISETWLSSNICDNELSIPGYHLFRRDRPLENDNVMENDENDDEHGGVACYVRDSHTAVKRSDLNDDEIEALWIEIKPKYSKPFLVCTFYRPPDCNVEYFNKFDNIVQGLNDDDIVILGDFNLDCLSDNTSKKVDDFCTNNQLSQIIDEPTRVTESSSTLIDLICVSRPEEYTSTLVVPYNVSDHYLVKTIKMCNKAKTVPKMVTSRCYKSFNEASFIHDISCVDWNRVSDIEDPDDSWVLWRKMFLDVCNKHVPFKTRKVKGYLPPWITPEYKELSHKRDHQKRQAQLSGNPDDWRRAKEMRNKVNSLNKRLKREHFRKVIKENGNNTRKLWQTLRNHGGLGTKQTSVASTESKSECIAKANQINHHFCTIGHKVVNDTNADNHSNETSSECISSEDKMFTFSVVSDTYVYQQLKMISINKATGMDDIPAKLLKLAAPYIAKSLAHICNVSLKNGTIPNEWKYAKVTPIHKGGDTNDLNNYRPISVLPIISKILERSVHDQIYSYLQENNILSTEQSGFRPNHSTETALLDVTDYILNGMDKGKATGIVFLDLRKAFDTVNHDLLLKKLHDIGVRGIELAWFKSYLSDRKQSTAYQGTLSAYEDITIGVPQGSILGPLLFCIFVNDLPKFLTCKTVLYADDTALMFSSNDKNVLNINLNNNLKQVSEWLQRNKLSLNIAKTKYMICGTRQCIENFDNMSVLINDSEIEQVQTFKYLGIWFDPLLKWDYQVQNTSKKVSQRIGLVSRLRKFVPFKTTKLLANCLVLPYFDYCSLVWRNCSKDLSNKLQVLQNRLARIVLKEGPRAHIADMLEAMNWKTLNDRAFINLIHLVHKCLTNNAPMYLQTKFSYVHEHHHYPTKSSGKLNLYHDKVSTKAGERTLTYRGVKAWNNISDDLRSVPYNSKNFKKALREYV